MPQALNKSEIRKKYLRLRKNLAPDFRVQADEAICMNLFSVRELEAANTVAAYFSDGTEPDLSRFVKDMMCKNKKFCFPRSREKTNSTGEYEYDLAEISDYPGDFVKGAYGIPEPRRTLNAIPENEYDELLWLIPGVAFDMKGRRLGRGKAVYDRLLGNGAGFKIGVFYECQKCASVPEEEHDRPLDMIVTEKGVYRCQ
ncbi:MAG: 5-formyltetrahydrofolate cyclo-ligase [Lentisphaerae bacterium GWF2_44_16]|nr:MAG: 5-formyltetrahydrofolate cyclo-ligase [Lentisphaerae bacterium GWF2_44_16]